MDMLNTYESATGELVKIDENYIKDARTKIYKLHEEGKVSNWESYYFRKDKKVVPVEQNIVDLHHTKGERTGSVAIIRDIAGRKKGNLITILAEGLSVENLPISLRNREAIPLVKGEIESLLEFVK